MKKIRIVTLLLAASASGLVASAQTKLGDFYFNLDSATLTASVARSSDYLTMESVQIPSTVEFDGDTYQVTAIGEQAFQQCVDMKSIELPSGLLTIGKWAFYGCTGLTEIEFPENLTELVIYAFQKCSGLEKVKFNDNLTTIGASAFSNCTSLQEVDLPENLRTIDVGAFNNCVSLSRVTFGPNVEFIGQNAFYSCGLTEFSFPESIKSFEAGILSQNKKLETVTFAASMKTTGQQTVRECTALTTINIPEGIENLDDGSFYGCSALKEIKLPSTLNSLSSNVFYGCSSLENVDLPAAVTEIPSAAFYNCSGLLSLPGGDNITKIAKNAFYGCSSLTEISLSKKLSVIPSHCFDRCTSLEKVIIPDNITEFEDSPFHYCTSLKSLDIPASVLYMPGNPAIGAESIEAYNVAADNPNYASVDGVLYDKAVTSIVAFPGAKTEYDMPESVTEITDFALNALPNLQKVTFSPNLTKIGQSAMYGTKLTSVDLSNTKVESIGMTAFFLVTSITEFIFPNNDFTLGSTCLGGISVTDILFPEGVTSIGIQGDAAASVLSMDANLKTIWLPSTLTKIVPFGGSSANLTTVYSWATTPPEFVAGTTTELPKGTTVKVPKGSKEAYEKAWKDVYTNVTYDDCLPLGPTVEVAAEGISLTWETYTDDVYPADIECYELTLWGDSDTPVLSKKLNKAGGEGDASSIPAEIALTLGQYDEGTYTVSLKGYTAKNQLVMNFTKDFEVADSGIDAILQDVDSTTAEYFDITGQKVTTPQKGKLYIERRTTTSGHQSSKKIIR